jgi:DNA-binding transcriptional LysR family regulator
MPGYVAAGVLDDELLAVLPAGHRLAQAGRITLEELAAAGFVDPGGTCGPVLAASFAAQGVPWRPDHLVREVSAVLAMVAAGITAGMVPAMAVPLSIPDGVVLRPLAPRVQRGLYVHHAPGDEVAVKFAAWLLGAPD